MDTVFSRTDNESHVRFHISSTQMLGLRIYIHFDGLAVKSD